MPTLADISGLLVPTVAVLGLWIAYRQWRTAQNRLKLDLFERRLAIYDAARDMIKEVRGSGKVTDVREFEYIANTRGAIWLFDRDIVRYLDEELWHKFVDLGALTAELDGLRIGEERSKNIKAQREIKDWLGDQLRVMEKKFAPFLRLSH